MQQLDAMKVLLPPAQPPFSLLSTSTRPCSEGDAGGPPPLGGGAFGYGGEEEEAVRAPLPVRTERLYGEEAAAYRPPMGPRRRADPVPINVADAFRDFG